VALAHGHQALGDIGTGADLHAQAIARMLAHEAPVSAGQQPQARAGQRGQVGQA
jgi:hypothetical protein